MIKLLAFVILLLLSLGLAPGTPILGPDLSFRRSCPRVRTAAVDLAAYQGRWYQIATNVEFYRLQGRPDLGGSCVTANYTLRAVPTDGPASFDLLNCLYLRTTDQVACASGTGRATDQAGNLTVQVGPFSGPEPYLILDVFGRPEQGYRVALVYSCSQRRPNAPASDGFFVLSRTPRLRFGPPELLLYLLRPQQRGIRVAGRPVFFPQTNCKYFDTVPETIDFFSLEPPPANLSLH